MSRKVVVPRYGNNKESNGAPNNRAIRAIVPGQGMGKSNTARIGD
jgi:hypothetical protein